MQEQKKEPQNMPAADKITVEDFLEHYYCFRRNRLRGVVEFKRFSELNELWRPLTEEAINSIVLHSKRELGEDVDLKADIKTYVNSEEPVLYDPVVEYMNSLPEWDKRDRMLDFWHRIPGITPEQAYWLTIWFLSMVAHWLDLDDEHGNECVPLLIGNQGIGKTTFCVKILPPELRPFFLDHFNLGNKFDKEMALSNTLLINLDEIDRYSVRQMAEIKQALSKSKVNGRRIYGRNIEEKARKASFFGTTNHRQPLTDPTGSRRFICVEVPEGEYIDFATEIDYRQLFAQALYMLKVEKARYWFSNEENQSIQQHNIPYQRDINLEEMINNVFRSPDSDEVGEKFTVAQIQQELKQSFPRVAKEQMTCIKVGKVMKSLGITKQRDMKNTYYSLLHRTSA